MAPQLTQRWSARKVRGVWAGLRRCLVWMLRNQAASSCGSCCAKHWSSTQPDQRAAREKNLPWSGGSGAL